MTHNKALTKLDKEILALNKMAGMYSRSKFVLLRRMAGLLTTVALDLQKIRNDLKREDELNDF